MLVYLWFPEFLGVEWGAEHLATRPPCYGTSSLSRPPCYGTSSLSRPPCYGTSSLSRLPNLSQTCYMNSVLQSLLTLVPFVKELNKQSQQWLSHPKALLFKLLTDINNCFTTKNSMQKKSTLVKFLRTIALHHPEFRNDAQQVIILLFSRASS
ncbi:ubiquitin carboxyl-terminal hydrolase 26-like [Takifugu flavidus]|uniref:ubiquitin carboxyl-terminal hydrolase 26-like n=1 Tax=Takifugu flavidus TaxID=433684 RepID=UPI0025440320|nr:ubiquitin carboxyl-terminal hydrolase 26-like [Takifugu flavidus]